MRKMNYDDGVRNYSKWPSTKQQQQQQQQQLPQRQNERLWVEISDDEESIFHGPQVFQSDSSKFQAQVTPPLDLTVMEKGSAKASRQVESPLDLSVKTRKRFADTTDLDELHGRSGHAHEIGMAKKMRMNLEEMQFHQDNSRAVAAHLGYEQGKAFGHESIIRKKLLQNSQQQMPIKKLPSATVHRPQQMSQPSNQLSLSQQYSTIERQHQLSRQSRQSQIPLGQNSFESRQQPQASPYDGMQNALSRQRPSSSSETVALQGFFEPTQKVTVNASTNLPVPGFQQNMPRVQPDPESLAKHSVNNQPQYSVQRSRTITGAEGQGGPIQYPPSPAYSSGSGIRSNRVQSNTQMTTVANFDLMQQKKMHQQQQRQIQMQRPSREQQQQQLIDSFQTQMVSQSMMSNQQERQRMMDVYKQIDASVPTSQQRQYPLNKGSISPYAQKHSPFSGANVQNSQHDDQGYSNSRFIRASQPVTLSDISQHSRTIEKAQLIQTNPNPMSQQMTMERSRFPAASHRHMMETMIEMSKSEVVDRTILSQGQRLAERDPMYTRNEQAAQNSGFSERIEHSPSLGYATHQSMMQKPRGFIPPRVVSGSGRPSAQANVPFNRRDERVAVLGSERLIEEQRRQSNELPYPSEAMFKRQNESSYNRLSPRTMPFGENKLGRSKQDQEHVNINKSDAIPAQTSYQREINSVQHQYTRGKYASETPRRDSLSGHIQRSPTSRPASVSKPSPSVPQMSPVLGSKPSPNITVDKKILPTSETVSYVSQTSSAARSITRGTSGLSKTSHGNDFLSQLVIRELKKTDDDIVVNPFANRSLLQEYDRSANSSPTRPTESHLNVKKKTETVVDITNDESKDKVETDDQSQGDKSSYTLPLQIAIPGHKSSFTQPAQAPRTSVIVGAKQEPTVTKTPRMMSRKHMILSAFQQEEDLKNTVNIDKDEKVPIESSKFLSKRSSEKESNQSFPPSPKMPILSPQEKNRTTPLVSPAVGEPPVLEGPSASSATSAVAKPNKEMNMLEEQLHKLISDAVKGINKDNKEAVYETVRRELNTQPQGHKVFLSRQSSQTRNIPVANVAPIVHGKNLNHLESSEKGGEDNKGEIELDEEDEKMAELVTRSLLGRSYESNKKSTKSDENKSTDKPGNPDMNKEFEGECSNSSSIFPSLPHEHIFDDNSDSKRLSPGIKKLLMYRHRDIQENSRNADDIFSNKTKSDTEPSVSTQSSASKSPKEGDKARNVFGAFSEIIAQKCSGPNDLDDSTRWTGSLEEEEGHAIQLQQNSDYEGDDEDGKEQHRVKRSTHSSTKQQADRLIKRARHRHKTGGYLRTRAGLCRRGTHQKGFVDFMPKLLPRRTRPKLKGKSPQRKKSKKRKSFPIATSPSSHQAPEGHVNTYSTVSRRQRRASSLDRETRAKQSKAKNKQLCYSDNELDHTDNSERLGDHKPEVVEDTWHNEDESTDEEYFQNYEDDFKDVTPRAKARAVVSKKSTTVRKKKSFHFQQKYIFQRKRKSKNRSKGFETKERSADKLDEIYNFHEEGHDLLPFPSAPSDLGIHGNIPIPAEVKRLAVNKDTGETLLHRAARMGYEEVALYCLATGSVDVNARDNAGYTALHECAVRGGQKIAKHLLKHGADVNCSSVDGIRPIHDAVENDQLEMVRLLLSYGSDPTLSTYAGRTLMKIARTERMRNYLQAYLSDLNGYNPDSSKTSWQFKTSSTCLDSEDHYGCAIYGDAPSDPEDESLDLVTLSSKPVFRTCQLTPEYGKRQEDYVLVDDILNSYRISQSEWGTLGLPNHLVKNLSASTVSQHHENSVYRDLYKDKTDSILAVRSVDLTQVISKLDKVSHTGAKRSKV